MYITEEEDQLATTIDDEGMTLLQGSSSVN
jgi:hypothetical protein